MFTGIVDQALQKYARYHQHPANEKVHLAGIPLIITGLIIATPVWIFLILMAGYLFISFRDGLGLALFFWPFVLLGLITPWWIGLIVIAVSFGVQLVTHKVYEGGYPAIFSHPEHVWAAPIWWIRRVLRAY